MTAQHQQGRLTRALVLGEAGPGGEGEQRLAQRLLVAAVPVAAVHGVGRAPAGRGGGAVEQFPGTHVERDRLHARQSAWCGAPER
ncbi:hypothetical protein [Microbispora triticiradicis]|uniref:hypothetical protein n=1 Tax=Microbispora triticiradicis TaxID=2200763 RepID=UPI001AD8449B|nr:hypothetical protein [Microbispora triticiradicis]